MKQKKISVNIVYSILLQISSIIAPLITAPYIARVLSAELIGDYSYVLANSSYFVLVALGGIPLYGTLKCAAIRDNKTELSKLFWEIMALKISLTGLCTVVYLVLFFGINVDGYKVLYTIMLLNLWGNALDLAWFFNGLEEFRVIAIRSMIVRIFCIFAILLLVNNKDDIYIYAIIVQGSTVAGYVSAYPELHDKIEKVQWRELKVLRHLVPTLPYFIPGLINTIFSSADKTMLGVFCNNAYEVGVYEQANKICQLCIMVISAISNVIFPRVSYLYNNSGNKEKLSEILHSSIRIAVFAAVPISFGIAGIADYFVPFFYGPGYEKSALLLKILCFNVLFVTLSNFCGQQCLIGRNRQKEYNVAVCVGALSNVAINFCLVRDFQSIGVSMASAIASFLGLILIMWYGRDAISFKNYIVIMKNYVIAAMGMILIIRFIVLEDIFVTLSVRIVLGAVIYFVILCLLKDQLLLSVVSELIAKLNNKKR